MSDVIVVMRDGRVQQQGRPEELYQRPVNRFVAGFIGSSNFLEAVLVGHEPATGRATVETGAGLRIGGIVTDPDARPTAGDPVTVAIRPERLRVEAPGEDEPAATADGWLRTPGRVAQGTYLGDQTEYRVDTQALGNLIIRRPNETGERARRTFGPGEAVVVAWRDDANLVLVA